jgi:hypothetical protein
VMRSLRCAARTRYLSPGPEFPFRTPASRNKCTPSRHLLIPRVGAFFSRDGTSPVYTENSVWIENAGFRSPCDGLRIAGELH